MESKQHLRDSNSNCSSNLDERYEPKPNKDICIQLVKLPNRFRQILTNSTSQAQIHNLLITISML